MKAGVALAGAGILLWGLLLARAGRPGANRRVRDAALLTLGALAALCWGNLFRFHTELGTYLHPLDTYHYYLGAKYFRELGYARLYECTVVADVQAGLVEQARTRWIRDLETNRLRPTGAIVTDPTTCTARFSPERWRMFEHDVAWFRARVSPGLWARAQQDHGYNATPVWGVLGTLLADLGPATDRHVLLLALLDPVLLLAMWAAVAWTFGWRVTCVGLIYWGTNFPARFGFTGGAYLRHDWLALSVVGICLLRRHRTLAAGFALTWATLLRVFPGAILLTLALQTVARWWRERRVTVGRWERRFAAGCGAAALVLLPASLWVAGSSAWPGFVENSRKLSGTPLTNHVGLKTIVGYDPETRVARIAPVLLEADPYEFWKAARHRVFHARRYVFAAIVAGFLVLLVRTVARQPEWVAAVLGVGLVPVATELTSYYYAMLLVFAFLWPRRPEIGVALCTLSAVTLGIAAVSRWPDEQYTAISVAVVAFVVLATVSVLRGPEGTDGAGRAGAHAPR